jgi:hypothetical protein
MPDIIANNLQSIIVLVIVVVALVSKILEGINANKRDSGPPMEDIFGPDSEPDEGDRQFHPAVPPPIRQATTPPPLRQVPPPPPLERVAMAGDMKSELARQRGIEERIRKIREAKLKTQAASAPVHEVAVAHRQAPISHSLNLRLHNTKELRQAFVLKEILDRPVGLR